MNQTILVVEDNAINMELVTDLLTSMGFRVLPFDNAEEALVLASSTPPHLILMDISLPGMDGLTATRLLKSDSATAHIPVVALTAHAMADDRKIAMSAGCDAYLTKPIDTRTFSHTVSALLNGGR